MDTTTHTTDVDAHDTDVTDTSLAATRRRRRRLLLLLLLTGRVLQA